MISKADLLKYCSTIQAILLLAVVAVSLANLTFGSAMSDLWVSLVSVAFGAALQNRISFCAVSETEGLGS